VVAVGEQVTTIAVGDVVAGVDDAMVGENRAQADLVLLDAEAVAVVPAGLDPVDAASIPLNSLTAAQAVDLLGDPEGRTLLVTGAGGAVGGYAVALARSAGWAVTGLGRANDEEFVRSTGAEFTADAERSAYDAVLDGAVLQQEGLVFVRDGGTFVGVQPSAPVPTERGITVKAVKVVRDAARWPSSSTGRWPGSSPSGSRGRRRSPTPRRSTPRSVPVDSGVVGCWCRSRSRYEFE
jgi:NADPH:quinone reductase-like Zn-dependent oxidoreductase